MNYTLVDKNLLIPEILKSTEYFYIVSQLYKKTYLRNKEYCSNIYIVKYNLAKFECTIEFDGETFYELNDNIKKNLNLDFNNIFIKHNIKNDSLEFKSNVKLSNLNNKQMILTFNEEQENSKIKIISKKEVKFSENIIDNNKIDESNNKIDESNNKKKEELIKACEQVMDMYNLEINNIKKTEFKIKSLDSKLEKLEKKKIEKIILDISKTKGDYETWKKIKYIINKDHPEDILKSELELELREDPIVPILFTAKYNYFENAVKNDKIKNMFDILNKISIDQLYISDTIELDNEIINYCDKYFELSKKDLHYQFDHDWDYLDTEMNASSKSGSLSMFE